KSRLLSESGSGQQDTPSRQQTRQDPSCHLCCPFANRCPCRASRPPRMPGKSAPTPPRGKGKVSLRWRPSPLRAGPFGTGGDVGDTLTTVVGVRNPPPGIFGQVEHEGAAIEPQRRYTSFRRG